MGNSENNIIGKRFEYGLLAKYWKVINLSIGILGLLLTPYLRNLNDENNIPISGDLTGLMMAIYLVGLASCLIKGLIYKHRYFPFTIHSTFVELEDDRNKRTYKISWDDIKSVKILNGQNVGEFSDKAIEIKSKDGVCFNIYDSILGDFENLVKEIGGKLPPEKLFASEKHNEIKTSKPLHIEIIYFAIKYWKIIVFIWVIGVISTSFIVAYKIEKLPENHKLKNKFLSENHNKPNK